MVYRFLRPPRVLLTLTQVIFAFVLCVRANGFAGDMVAPDDEDAALPPPVGQFEADGVAALDAWPPIDVASGAPDLLLTATETDRVELRATYRSSMVDVAAIAGRRTGSAGLSEQYSFLGLRTPWLSVGRLSEPLLYRLAARSVTSAADLDRRSLDHPFGIVTSFPSFTTASDIINRVVLHPFGDTLSVWAGESGSGERETGALVRIGVPDGFAVEGLGLLHLPKEDTAYRTDDSWFPERPFDPDRAATSGGILIWGRSAHAAGVCALVASGSALWFPGAGAVIQGRMSGTVFEAQIRSSWVTPHFRTLRNGLPAETSVSDFKLDIGPRLIAGITLSGAYTLYRPPARKKLYLPDRSVAAVKAHIGPEWLQAAFEARIRRDRDESGSSVEEARGGASVNVGESKRFAQAALECNLYMAQAAYDRTVVSAALRAGNSCVLWLKPSLELRADGQKRFSLAGSLSLDLPPVTARVALQTRHPLCFPANEPPADVRSPVIVLISIRLIGL